MDNDQERTQQSSADTAEHDRRELIRDWELLFWAFLMFGFGRLLWLYLTGAENRSFQLGVSCGFLFCGILGFLMRYVLSPRSSND